MQVWCNLLEWESAIACAVPCGKEKEGIIGTFFPCLISCDISDWLLIKKKKKSECDKQHVYKNNFAAAIFSPSVNILQASLEGISLYLV